MHLGLRPTARPSRKALLEAASLFVCARRLGGRDQRGTSWSRSLVKEAVKRRSLDVPGDVTLAASLSGDGRLALRLLFLARAVPGWGG